MGARIGIAKNRDCSVFFARSLCRGSLKEKKGGDFRIFLELDMRRIKKELSAASSSMKL